MRQLVDPLFSKFSLLFPILLIPAVLAPFILFGVLSVAIFSSGILPEYERRAKIVAIGVQKRLEIAQQLFGPLKEQRNLSVTLLDAYLSSEEVAFIVVTAPDGTILAKAPERFEGLEQILLADHEGPVDDSFDTIVSKINQFYERVFHEKLLDDPPQDSHRAENYLITSLAIGDVDDPAGFVKLGTDVALLDQIRWDEALDSMTVFLAALLFGAECLLLLFTVNVLRPKEMLRFLTDRLAKQDFRYIVNAKVAGKIPLLIDTIGVFIGRVARDTAQLSNRPANFLLPEKGIPEVIEYPAATYIRLPLFLFFLSEAILRPMLPSFLGNLQPLFEIDKHQQAGIAMAFFLFGSIFGILIALKFVERTSARTTFIIGTLVTLVGILGHLFVSTIVEAALLRAVAGVGYGIVYGAAQIYIVQHVSKARRTAGFSFFLAVVVGAEITGPAIGGILADRLGEQFVFMSSAIALVFAIIAGLAILSKSTPTMIDDENPQPILQKVSLWSMAKMLARNTRFTMLMICFTVPAKLLLTGGIFLLIPIAALNAGATATDIGRIMMCYGIVILGVSGRLSYFIDYWALYGEAVAVGALLSSVGLILPSIVGGLPILYLSVALFGLGQSILIPAQASFLLRVTKSEVEQIGPAAIVGQFRLYDRIGSFVGPIIGALLLSMATPSEALLILGSTSILVCGLGCMYFLASGEANEDEAIDSLLIQR